VDADVTGSAAGERDVRANRRRARLLFAAGGVVPGLLLGVVLGALLGPIVGAVAGVVALVVVALSIERSARTVALRALGGSPVDEDDHPRLANLVEGLCASFGVAKPELWIVADHVPNACTVGDRRGRNVLVVTTGLEDRLGLIEMEGVVAHELAHVKRGDPVVSAAAVAVLGPLVRLTGNDRLVHAALGRGREYRADQLAALTVRYPPGLGEALDVLQQGPAPAATSVFTGRRWAITRWLWVDPMVGDRGVAAPGELDATAVRRSALAEW
jgi:Zn-dependent protease with chaperone function